MNQAAYQFILVLRLLSLGVSSFACDLLAAEERTAFNCTDKIFNVNTESSQDRILVCEGAKKAHAFFKSHGIEVKRPIHIKLHNDGIQNHAGHLGLYGAKNNHIDLLTFKNAKKLCIKLRPFEVNMNESLYMSFVAHEVAHAITDQNFNHRPSSFIVHEYLAYVTQLATMETRLQTDILQHFNLEPFASLENMSPTYYHLNPSAFGVKVFLHYQSLPAQSKFIQNLLAGVIKPNTQQTDEW